MGMYRHAPVPLRTCTRLYVYMQYGQAQVQNRCACTTVCTCTDKHKYRHMSATYISAQVCVSKHVPNVPELVHVWTRTGTCMYPTRLYLRDVNWLHGSMSRTCCMLTSSVHVRLTLYAYPDYVDLHAITCTSAYMFKLYMCLYLIVHMCRHGPVPDKANHVHTRTCSVLHVPVRHKMVHPPRLDYVEAYTHTSPLPVHTYTCAKPKCTS